MINFDTTEYSTLEDAQLHLERMLIKHGYDDMVSNYTHVYKSIIEGDPTIDTMGLPKGKELFFEVYNSVHQFLTDYTTQETTKRRKSKFYDFLISPMFEMHYKDLNKKKYNKDYEIVYENPINLLSYFISRELIKLMALDEIVLTVMCRHIANTYTNAYNFFGEACDDQLGGMIQIIRLYVDTQYCKFFKTVNKIECIVVVLKEEYETINVSKEEIIEQIHDTKTAYKPMLTKPHPHHNLLDHDGGYYEIPSPLLKNPEFADIRQMPFSATNEYGKQFFESINTMQSTAWCINKEFFSWLKQCNDERISKMFNNNLPKMQSEFNKYKKEINKQIHKLRKTAKQAKFDSTQTTNEEKKTNLLREHLNSTDKVMELLEELSKQDGVLGKARGWQATITDAEYYQQFEEFYHPLFCDNRGRVYTYNTSLSFQGNSLAKNLVSTKTKQRIDSDGLYELQVLLGGMLIGYDKKSATVRYNRVQELTEAFTKCIEHEDYSVLDLIDEDEIISALNIMYNLYWHERDSTYTTGMLAYIDATSSAIQIQAVLQKCEKSASLTNLLPNDSEDLPDAYKAVALHCQQMCEEISTQTDEELFAALAAFYLENDETKLVYMGIKL